MNIAIIILILIIILIILYNCNNLNENFIDGENVNINTIKKIKVFNSSFSPPMDAMNYNIEKKASINANKEKFVIKYPLKYDKFVEKKKNKIAQCISAVEESYDYPDSDIDSYIKKTEIPSCPEVPNMDLYIKKIDIPSCPEYPDMKLYIKKTDIPPYPDLTKYVKKTDIHKYKYIKSKSKSKSNNFNPKPILDEPNPYEKSYW